MVIVSTDAAPMEVGAGISKFAFAPEGPAKTESLSGGMEESMLTPGIGSDGCNRMAGGGSGGHAVAGEVSNTAASKAHPFRSARLLVGQ